MTKLFKIRTTSTFVHTYFIEAREAEHAKDEITMRDSGSGGDYFEEAAQEHIGETIVSCDEVNMHDFARWLAAEQENERSMSATWLGTKLIRQVQYEDEEVQNDAGMLAFRDVGTSLILGTPRVE